MKVYLLYPQKEWLNPEPYFDEKAIVQDLGLKTLFLAAAKVGGIVANSKAPADFMYVNMMLEMNVINAAWRHGCRKLEFLGWSCIYPRMAPQPMPESCLLTSALEQTNEAYALANAGSANDFGHEAIEVILKNMEDHRKDLIVIVAGYTDRMERFIHANPGLESRFNKYFFFEDYDGGQLMDIFRSMCKKNGYTLSEEGEQFMEKDLQGLYEERDENFGNARDVRNLFEQAVARQADRVSQLEEPTKEQLMELRPEDLEEGHHGV